MSENPCAAAQQGSERIILNGWWPKLVAGIITVLFGFVATGTWSLAFHLGAQTRAIIALDEKIVAARKEIIEAKEEGKEFEREVKQEHKEFRNRFILLERGK